MLQFPYQEETNFATLKCLLSSVRKGDTNTLLDEINTVNHQKIEILCVN